MASITPDDLSEAFRSTGFVAQLNGEDVSLVRALPDVPLFLRIDVLWLGRHLDTAIADLAVIAVRNVHLQFRGLLIRGELKELYTDPDSAKVSFASPHEWRDWLQRLARVAPRRAAELGAEKSAELLERTANARTVAQRVWAAREELLCHPAKVAAKELLLMCSSELRAAHQRLCPLPFMVLPRYRQHHEAAIAALLLEGDAELLSLAALEGISSLDLSQALSVIAVGCLVPESVIWKLRLLVDAMLASEAASETDE